MKQIRVPNWISQKDQSGQGVIPSYETRTIPGAQGDGRAAKREFVGSPAMRVAEFGAFGRLSPGPVTGVGDLA